MHQSPHGYNYQLIITCFLWVSLSLCVFSHSLYFALVGALFFTTDTDDDDDAPDAACFMQQLDAFFLSAWWVVLLFISSAILLIKTTDWCNASRTYQGARVCKSALVVYSSRAKGWRTIWVGRLHSIVNSRLILAWSMNWELGQLIEGGASGMD